MAGLSAFATAVVAPGAAGGAEPATTERVTIGYDGSEPDDWSSNASLSADGRFLAFDSLASNLVEGDDNDYCYDLRIKGYDSCSDIFLKDLLTGELSMLTVLPDGTQADGFSKAPSLSATGRYVAFDSAASNLVEGDTNEARDIFVLDRETGVFERVSVSSSGSQGNKDSVEAAISHDGRFVAFKSFASNLVKGDTNDDGTDYGGGDVFVHDRQTGVTERVSLSSRNEEVRDGGVFDVALSGDGRVVAFQSYSVDYVPGAGSGLYVRDLRSGTTESIGVGVDGSPANGSEPSLSFDGRLVAFHSGVSRHVAGDTNESTDVFVFDRATRRSERVSVATGGGQAEKGGATPVISADGRFVAFHSESSDLSVGDENGVSDIYVRDRANGITTRIGTSHTGKPAFDPWISGDGMTISFVADVNDPFANVYVRHGARDSVPDGMAATTERLAWATPATAAVAMSRARFVDAGAEAEPANGGVARRPARHVVLSRDDVFADSLAGTPLTAEGPMLFTDSALLSRDARREVNRVLGGQGTVYVLGGEGAIAASVVDELASSGYEPVRLSGSTRVRTSIEIASQVRRLYGGETVLLARAFAPPGNPTAAWADSVSGGAYAAARRVPVIVTHSDQLDADVAQWLEEDAPSSTVLLGGTAALSPAVAAAVPNPRRVSGPSRHATAAAVSTELWGVGPSGQRSFFIVNGHEPRGWAYGFAAAGMSADFKAPLLMVTAGEVPEATRSLVTSSSGGPEIETFLLGDLSAIPEARQRDLDRADAVK